MLWMDHLEAMDYMRSSVGLRAYGQRDPLIEYKNEGTKMFKEMEASLAATFVKLVSNVQKSQQQPQASQLPLKQNETSAGKQLGRNDPCYCGSGKKYKRCHGA